MNCSTRCTAAVPYALGRYGWRFLDEEIAVKDEARNEFGHHLSVPASLPADSGLGLLYELLEFFF